MSGSLKRLLSGVIDYAGVFPPAALTLEEAVDRYAAFHTGPEAWILNRFICPVAWLNDLLPLMMRAEVIQSVEDGGPWPLSVLGTSVEGYRQDLQLIDRFLAEAGPAVDFQCYEMKANAVANLAPSLKPLVDIEVDEIYVELPWGADMRDGLHALVDAEHFGAKARTGGLEAAAFPSSQELAQFVQECVNLDLPFKLTAGLHHPVRRYDEGVSARMHGFVNVLMATALALSEGFSVAEIAALLDDEDPQTFIFSADGAAWRGVQVDNDTIDDARDLFTAFGSCSVDEPLDDLRALGWLDKELTA